jgi:hypothetical protein
MARIEGFWFGRAIVDGRDETRDVVVLPEPVIRNWSRKSSMPWSGRTSRPSWTISPTG